MMSLLTGTVNTLTYVLHMPVNSLIDVHQRYTGQVCNAWYELSRYSYSSII